MFLSSASSLVGLVLISLSPTATWADYTSDSEVPTATIDAGVIIGKST